jgi:hypothetical protein
MKSKSKSRRAFLLTAAVGGTGAAIAVATTGKQAERPSGVAQAPAAGDGYRMSEHIQKYYKTTEV